MKTASWVIINKETGNAIFETFEEKTARAINRKKYEAIPILEYLQGVNGRAYHLVAVNTATGRRVNLTATPLSHRDCMTVKSKQSDATLKSKTVCLQLEEIKGVQNA